MPSENRIITPSGILQPQLPEGQSLRPSGIVTPSDYGTGLAKPGEKTILHPANARPRLRLEVAGTMPTASEQRQGIDRDYLFFISRPWDYLQSLFLRHNVHSPIPEIQERIKNVQAARPPVEQTILSMLRSPLEYVRVQAIDELKERGMEEGQIQDLLRSETQLIDPASLTFSKDRSKPPGETIAGFSRVLTEAVRLIPAANEVQGNAELFEVLKMLPRYLLPVTEAIQYHTSQFRLSNPALLDELAAKLEGLASQAEPAPSSALIPLCDLLSHFTFDSSAASNVFLNILERSQIQHPLRDHLVHKCNRPERNAKPENVGIEIECLPQILTGNPPRGFTMGIDGGATLPELRRDTDKLEFNNQYRDDLYELWYWARMSRLQGVSIHIHLDHTQYRMAVASHIFISSFGYDSVRKREPRESEYTVEMRFPLDSYPEGNTNLLAFQARVMPFNPGQFDLSSGLSALIDTLSLPPEQVVQPNCAKYPISQLPEKWARQISNVLRTREREDLISGQKGEALIKLQKDLRRSKRLSPDGAVTLAQAIDELYLILGPSSPPHGENAVAAIALGKRIPTKKGRRAYFEHLRTYLFARNDPSLPVSDVMYLLQNGYIWHGHDSHYLERLISLIPNGKLTLTETKSIIHLIKKNNKIPGGTLPHSLSQKLGQNTLTLQEAEILASQFEVPWHHVFTQAIQREFITYELIADLIESRNYAGAFNLIERMPEGSLSFDQAVQLIEVQIYHTGMLTTPHIFHALPAQERTVAHFDYLLERRMDETIVTAFVGSLPKGAMGWQQISKILFKDDLGCWYSSTIVEALRNAKLGPLTETQIMQIALGSENDPIVLAEAINMSGALTFELASRLHELTGDNEILQLASAKICGPLSIEQIEYLVDNLPFATSSELTMLIESGIRSGLLRGERGGSIVSTVLSRDRYGLFDTQLPLVGPRIIATIAEMSRSENSDFWTELADFGVLRPGGVHPIALSALCNTNETFPTFHNITL